MYTAISFAPVQGFIEKSRKLRDLIGASQILSYLSAYLIDHAKKNNYIIISPALIKTSGDEPEKGLPNLIIIKGDQEFLAPDNILLEGWKKLLVICRDYIEDEFPKKHKLDNNEKPYRWDHSGWEEAWKHWGNHAWEIFVAYDGDRQKALDKLEAQKLGRGWTAINWTGESSSLSGQDAICHPRMGLAPYLAANLTTEERKTSRQDEEAYIDKFYDNLADITSEDRQDGTDDDDSINKFINTNERLSLPELVKRLATRDEIIDQLDGLMPNLEKGFRDIIRTPQPPKDKPTPPFRQWTGWFMGDGDNISDHLKKLGQDKQLSQEEQDQRLQDFSKTMRQWGKDFTEGKTLPKDDVNFAKGFKMGRVIYAGGDDFFGVIYDRKFNGHQESCITGTTIIDWLIGLKQQWQTPPKIVNDEPVNFSMGFVWAAPSVPQRDILQHCREAEKLAKSKGRERVTIRTVFNNGQYVQWTCPWDLITILQTYQDRDGRKNWGHIYGDLAQLEARHAFCLGGGDRQSFQLDQIIDAFDGICEFMSLYFPTYKQDINLNLKNQKRLFGEDKELVDRSWAGIQWSRDLVRIGWQLCR